MRFFIDTEFIESGPYKPIQLISIGIVAQNGHELYEVSCEYNPLDASEWVKANVLPWVEHYPKNPLSVIRKRIEAFITRESETNITKPEFWGYYADYDWVAFCQIFGAMVDLPRGWPMYCRDIKQLCDYIGNPRLPPQEAGEHNALNDARWNLQAYNYLTNISK